MPEKNEKLSAVPHHRLDYGAVPLNFYLIFPTLRNSDTQFNPNDEAQNFCDDRVVRIEGTRRWLNGIFI